MGRKRQSKKDKAAEEATENMDVNENVDIPEAPKAPKATKRSKRMKTRPWCTIPQRGRQRPRLLLPRPLPVKTRTKMDLVMVSRIYVIMLSCF